MIPVLAANTVLVILLVMTNWDRVVGLSRTLYSFAAQWVTTSTVLVFYGLVLVYLIAVIHTPATITERSNRATILVPYYDLDGQQKGWVRERKDGTDATESRPNSLRLRRAPNLPPLSPELLRREDTASPPTRLSHINEGADFPPSTWDGFPDGDFRCHFTRQQVEDTSRLAFYWISEKLPGKRGSLDAVTPEKGKLSRYKCAGIIDCSAAVCTAQIAPGHNVARQIEAPCACGSPLRHRPCKVQWSVVFYKNGAIFENSGTHDHSNYTHLLLTPKNKKTLELQHFVAKQPVALKSSAPTSDSASGSSDSAGDENDMEAIKGTNAEHSSSHNDQGDRDGDGSEDELNSEHERALALHAGEDEDQS
ncbi:hypothetical protein GGX14DRAFT_626530 [Mycena pura]|uniref:Uncharacterized protein n=1 Tax=Mycena pura TaxID=153505 RepID=A0AAD6VFV5_9AGAR|nr:hypothetical protein GGX14DRAFT_626530 [Mycena pura]